jgi:hypothetical protein
LGMVTRARSPILILHSMTHKPAEFYHE